MSFLLAATHVVAPLEAAAHHASGPIEAHGPKTFREM